MEKARTNLWRLHIKQESQVKVADRCHFCIDAGIVGVGWGLLEALPNGVMEWATYCGLADPISGKPDQSVRRLHDDVKCGDLIWTRDRKGKYFIGRVSGEWEYRHTEGHLDADIHNVRQCEWKQVGDLSEVPGTVRNAFRPARTLQRIISRNETTKWFSMNLFNRLSGGVIYPLPDIRRDLLSLFDPADCEDLVAIFLQFHDWVVYPGTCKTDTQKFEFAMRNRLTGRIGAVQVKQGDRALHVSEYEQFDGDVCLFQTEKRYIGVATKPTTTLLEPTKMVQFCLENVAIMTPTIQRWIEWTKT